MDLWVVGLCVSALLYTTTAAGQSLMSLGISRFRRSSLFFRVFISVTYYLCGFNISRLVGSVSSFFIKFFEKFAPMLFPKWRIFQMLPLSDIILLSAIVFQHFVWESESASPILSILSLLGNSKNLFFQICSIEFPPSLADTTMFLVLR